MRFMFIFMLIVLLGTHFYVFYRLYQMMPPTWGKVIVIASGVILLSCFFLFFLARDVMSPTILSVVYRIGTSWFFIFLYLLMAMLLLDIVRITHLLPMQNFLYKSWIGFFSVTGVVAIIMVLGYLKYENKTRVELDIAFNKEQTAQPPLKIVAVSDLHLGYGIGRKEFERWVGSINAEKPDIILMAGDIIDNSVRPLNDQRMDEIFRQLESRYGIFACMGNHENISGSKESIEFLENAGVALLRDTAILVNDRVYIAGRKDRSSRHRKEISELVESLDRTRPVILLDHQPYALEVVEQNNINMQISGHTHRGQIWPISWITDAIYEVSHGYKLKGNSHIYVSSGLGLWGGKFRIGTQSEYVVINVTL